jgi:hypothetical protein
MDFTAFQQYPLQIINVSEDDNLELAAIELVVLEEIAYSGDATALESILPYFVYFKFCEDRLTKVTLDGESGSVNDQTKPSDLSMCRAWNKGAEKLAELCESNGATASLNYQSKRRVYP